MANPLKQAIAGGRPLLGVWVELITPAVAEMMGLCGYDVLLLDMEHGLATVPDVVNAMRAARGTGAVPVVRVPSQAPAVLKALMDHGAPGLMVPMVHSAAEAAAVVAACRYPPKGNRGLAVGITRATDYGLRPAADYVASVEKETFIACQIESVRGVRDATGIAAVDGVDMIFIGWNDLAADAGHMLDLDHPEVVAMVAEVVAAARAAGKAVGTVPSAGKGWERLVEEGFDLVIPSADIAVLCAFGRDEVARFDAATGRAGATPPA